MADIAQFYTNDDPNSIHELLLGSLFLKDKGLEPQPFPSLKVMSKLYHKNADNASCIDALTDFTVGQPGEDGNNFKVVPVVDNPDMEQLEKYLLPLLAFPNPDQDINEIFKELFRDKYGAITGNFDLAISDFFELNGQRRIAGFRYIPSHTVYKTTGKLDSNGNIIPSTLWAARDGKEFKIFNDFTKPVEKEGAPSLYHSRIIYRHHNYQGVGTIMKAFDEVRSQNELNDSVFHYAKNGFKGQMIYQDESTDNSETTEKQLKRMFQTLVKKVKQFGIFRVKGKGTWTQIQQTFPAEVYSSVMKMSKDRIFRVHQIPPKLLGEAGGTGNFETLDDFRVYRLKKINSSRVSFERDIQRLLIHGGIFDWKIEFNTIDLTPVNQDARTLVDLSKALETSKGFGITDIENANTWRAVTDNMKLKTGEI